ncbi:MAG: FlgD immunoglobulin-like domain containing protein [bacterium]
MFGLMLIVAVSVSIGGAGFERLPDGSPGSSPERMVRWGMTDRPNRGMPYPDTLILVGEYKTDGKARDVWVEYPYAYLASDWLGVEVIDVSDPTNPTLVRTIDTPGQAFDIMAEDSLVFVADDYSGFQILNSSGIVGGYDTPRIARGIFVQDTIVYVADYDSFLVFNVSDSAVPQLTGTLASLSSDAEIEAVFVRGSYAYLADGFAMYIVDVSIPSQPQYAGEYSDPDYWFIPYNIYVVNSLAYVANYFNELFVVDVSNPATPFRVSFVYPPSGFALDVKVSGDYAYVANYDGGVWAVDVSDPGNPQNAAVYDTPGLCSGVFVDSLYIYVADHYSLLIFECTPKGVAESHVEFEIKAFRLMQNVPNPFEHQTTIRYEIPRPLCVSVRIYDLAGRLVSELVDEERNPGVHSVFWDGKDEFGEDVPSGVYFCRLSAGPQIESRKMTLLK